MRLFTVINERLPMIWVLLGLLFNATGLYLGFEQTLSFLYLFVGWFCCVFGLALFVMRLRERPRTSAGTRLSPNFISAGSTVMTSGIRAVDNEQTTGQPDVE